MCERSPLCSYRSLIRNARIKIYCSTFGIADGNLPVLIKNIPVIKYDCPEVSKVIRQRNILDNLKLHVAGYRLNWNPHRWIQRFRTIPCQEFLGLVIKLVAWDDGHQFSGQAVIIGFLLRLTISDCHNPESAHVDAKCNLTMNFEPSLIEVSLAKRRRHFYIAWCNHIKCNDPILWLLNMDNIFNLHIHNRRPFHSTGIFLLDIGDGRIPDVIISRLVDQLLKRALILCLIVIQSAVIEFFTNFAPVRHIPVHMRDECSVMLSCN